MDPSNVEWLQVFFLRLCDGDWEHGAGFKIESLDNPGWWIEFNLEDTKLAAVELERVQIERSEHDWLDYRREGKMFRGACGPGNLDELLSIFRTWADTHMPPSGPPWADEQES